MEIILPGMSSLQDRIDILEAENKELRAWKAAAIVATPDWQAVGRVLNLNLGDSVPDMLLDTVEDLRQQLREAEKSLAVLREIKDVLQRQQNGQVL